MLSDSPVFGHLLSLLATWASTEGEFHLYCDGRPRKNAENECGQLDAVGGNTFPDSVARMDDHSWASGAREQMANFCEDGRKDVEMIHCK